VSYAAAARRLAKADPTLRRIIARVGPCRLKRYTRYFMVLCNSIVSQQLSGRVADVIFARFTKLYPWRCPTPHAVTQTPLARLRAIGLSRQKATYMKDLAAGFLDGRIRMRRLASQPNENIIAALTSIHGIGRWTAEMFLMFSLSRLDVLPVDDLGIQKAIQRWYGFRQLPAASTIRRIGRPWHPYETIACWYLWRSLR
jgi:DNA-3-methyladenine glycosylase II